MNDETHPVLTCAEAAELEQNLLRGEPQREWRAMTMAGRALGQAIARDYREIGELPAQPRILILAGKGHNAGDAFIAAGEILRVRPGAAIDVFFAMGEKALNPLARRAWSGLLSAASDGAAIRPFSLRRGGELLSQLEERCSGRYQICLDGVFGMNFRPPFREPMGEIIEWFNDHLKADLRAAVDLPSGLGDKPTDRAFRADFSYMTGSAKRPLFEPANAEWAGRLRYLDIGFFAGDSFGPREKEGVSRSVLLPGVLKTLIQLRAPMTHKRKFGHLLLVGGSARMPGAILMSVLAAVRSGVGLVTVAAPAHLVPSLATAAPEAMWIGCPETADGALSVDSLHLIERALSQATAAVIGPGVGTAPDTQALLEQLAKKADVPLVLDAEALQPPIVATLAARAEMRGKVVVTPHAGEFARIAGHEFSESGEEGLIEFSRESGVLTLLKGPPFNRLCDGDAISYGLAGGPVMARGGSGDLLAGITGAQVARTPDRVSEAVARAVVWHGLAGEAMAREFGQEAVRTTQLLDFLSDSLRS